MTEAVVERVRRSWDEVLGWCRVNAPATAAVIRGPADEGALTDAQAELGLRLPQELLAWLRLSNGVEPSHEGLLIPASYAPLGVHQIVEDWKRLTSYSVAAEEVLAATAQPAGSDCCWFLPAWIPLAADFCGGYLFVDLRSGPRHGCIGDYDKVEGFFAPPVWDSIGDMLDSVASALSAHPGDTDHDTIPIVEEGRLTWVDGPPILQLRNARPSPVSAARPAPSPESNEDRLATADNDDPTPQAIRLIVAKHEPPDPHPAGPT